MQHYLYAKKQLKYKKSIANISACEITSCSIGSVFSFSTMSFKVWHQIKLPRMNTDKMYCVSTLNSYSFSENSGKYSFEKRVYGL